MRTKVGCRIFPPPSTTQTDEKCIELKSIEIECDASKERIELSTGRKLSVELRFHRQFDLKVDRLDLTLEKQDDDDEALKIPIIVNGVKSLKMSSGDDGENENFPTGDAGKLRAELLKLDADLMRLAISFNRKDEVGVYRLRIATSHKNDAGGQVDYFVDNITILQE
uniref:Uncharacterized protein n=1 Tax=Romanomermis culicivorax TaxID=13658 RepID=A0A915K1J9_ROMCU